MIFWSIYVSYCRLINEEGGGKSRFSRCFVVAREHLIFNNKEKKKLRLDEADSLAHANE